MRLRSGNGRWTRRRALRKRTDRDRAVKPGHLSQMNAEKSHAVKTRVLGGEMIHLKLRRPDARDRSRSEIARALRSASAVSVDLTNEVGKAGATRHKVAPLQVMRIAAIKPSNIDPRRRSANRPLSR